MNGPPNSAEGIVSTPNAAIKRVRVLIVEDHTSLRQLLVSHLANSACYEVVGQSADGHDVVANCVSLKPQVLILDLELPNCDGLDLIDVVHAQSPETRILVFSGFTDASTVRRAIQAGACGFVEKTASLETFNRAIGAVSLGRPFYGDEILQTLPAIMLGQHENSASELSPRESEVLALVANGRSSKEIADGLGLSVRTIENHRSNIVRTLGVRNTADLTREAMRLGLVQVARRNRT